jgi:hypothetical protein
VAQSERGGGWCRAGSGAAAPDPNAAWRSSESGRRTRDGENREGRCGEGFRCRVGVGPVGSGSGSWAPGTRTRLTPRRAVWLVKDGAHAAIACDLGSLLGQLVSFFFFFLKRGQLVSWMSWAWAHHHVS